VVRALATAGAAALVLALPAHAADPPPVVVTATVSPAAVFFGDPAVLEVRALVDAARVDPGSVTLQADAGPLERVGSVERDEWRDGDVAQVGFRVVVACARLACLTAAPAPFRVVAQTRRGERLELPSPWPRLAVARRVPDGATQVVADDRPAPVRWRIAPDALTAMLLALALLLAAGSAALAAGELLRRRSGSERGDTALARALAAVRRSLGADESARRRATGRLARLLASRNPGLALAAEKLAWSPEPPEREALEELVERVGRPPR
jgi:hypothetical protein